MPITVDPLVTDLARRAALSFAAFDEQNADSKVMMEKARAAIVRLSVVIDAARAIVTEDRNRGGALARAIEAADAALKTGDT